MRIQNGEECLYALPSEDDQVLIANDEHQIEYKERKNTYSNWVLEKKR